MARESGAAGARGLPEQLPLIMRRQEGRETLRLATNWPALRSSDPFAFTQIASRPGNSNLGANAVAVNALRQSRHSAKAPAADLRWSVPSPQLARIDTIAYTYESLLSGGRGLTCCGDLLCAAKAAADRSQKPAAALVRRAAVLAAKLPPGTRVVALPAQALWIDPRVDRVLRSPHSFKRKGRAQENATMK